MENRFHTASLETLSFRWKYGNRSGTTGSSLAAGKRGSLVIPLPRHAPASGELELSVFDGRNIMIDRYLVPINPPQEDARSPTSLCSSGATPRHVGEARPTTVRLTETDKAWIIDTDTGPVTVNRKTGLFSVAGKVGKPLIEQAPFLMMPSSGKSSVKIVNGIPVDAQGKERDDGLFFSPVCGQWEPGAVKLIEQSASTVRIRVEGKYEQATGWFNYTFTGGGCEIGYVFKAGGGSAGSAAMPRARRRSCSGSSMPCSNACSARAIPTTS